MFGVLIPSKPVMTDFRQISESTLQLHVSDFSQVKYITVFAINPPPIENMGYSVYISPNNQEPIYLGQLNNTNFSISKPIQFVHKQEESTGIVFINIEPLKADQLEESAQLKLLQVGVGLVNDFEKFISSFEDVYYEGEHYVNGQAVELWAESLPERVFGNERFWAGVE